MKNLVKIFAVALLGIAAAACNEKEIAPETPTKVPGGNAGTVMFTATIPSSKGYDNVGKMTWEVGDQILLWTNNSGWQTVNGAISPSTYSNYVCDLVTVTSSMFTDDTHKTISFSIGSKLPDLSPARYFAATTHDLGIFYNINGAGASTIANKLNVVYAGTRPHLAIATCSSSETNLVFKNAACVFQWDTDGASINRIEMVVPDASDVDLRFAARMSATYDTTNGWTFKSEPNTTYDPASIQSWTNPQGGVRQDGPYYIMLAPGMTFANGFKFRIYTTDGLLTTFTPTSSSFTTSAGSFWDFGKLEERFTSNYLRYNAGVGIKVGDLDVNKATYGAAKLLNSTDADINSDYSVFFVPEDVSGNFGKGAKSSEQIIIGDFPGKRSSIVQSAGPVSPKIAAFKNIDFSYDNAYTNVVFWMNTEMENLTIDDCRFNLENHLINRSSYGLKNLTVKDSDLRVMKEGHASYSIHKALICCGGDITYSGEKILFTNNILYPEVDDAVLEWSIISNNNATHLSYDELVIENNTIYDIKGNGAYYHNLFTIGNAASINVSKNLFWMRPDFSGANLNWIRVSGISKEDALAAKDAGTQTWSISDNKLTGFVLVAGASTNGDGELVGAADAGWYGNTNPYPFVNTTPAVDGTFAVIPGLTGYGAVR